MKRRWNAFRPDQWWALVLAILMGVLVVVGLFKGMGLNRVFEGQLIDMDYRLRLLSEWKQSERFRLAQHKTALNILGEHPLLGIGFGNFTRVFQTYKDASTPSGEISTTTENMYLMFSVETGLLGLAAALAMVSAVFWVVYKGYRVTSDGDRQDMLLTFLASSGGFLINMGTWDALNEPVVRMTFWIVTGLALTAVRQAREACVDCVDERSGGVQADDATGGAETSI